MRIDARTCAVITIRTGLSGNAIRACLAGRTGRTSTRMAIMSAAKELGLNRIAAHVTAMLDASITRAA